MRSYEIFDGIGQQVVKQFFVVCVKVLDLMVYMKMVFIFVLVVLIILMVSLISMNVGNVF